MDKVQLAPSEKVGEGILEGSRVSGDGGDKGSARAGSGKCSLCTCRVSGQVEVELQHQSEGEQSGEQDPSS